MIETKGQAHILTRWADTVVAVRPTVNGSGASQNILVETTPVGEYLARLLSSMDGGGELRTEQIDRLEMADGQVVLQDRLVYTVSHSRALDEQLKRLVDVLIDLRWHHPRLMQLTLDLESRQPNHED